MKKLYRYEIDYKNYDEDTQVRLRELPVLRETELTYFVGHQFQTSEKWGAKPKRVRKSSMKKYAYETKEEAKKDFIRRTKKRVGWYEFWIEECKKGLEIMEKGGER